MFSKRVVAASAVVLTSLASVAGEPPASLKVADPAAQVTQTTYTSVFSTYKPAAETNVSPDKVWREANARVASEGMHGGADGGHAPVAQEAGAHAGHMMPTPGANPDPRGNQGATAKRAGQVSHEGHQMPAKAAAPTAPKVQPSPSGHTGHQMTPAAKSDPHAGHQMTPAAKPDPHAGHQMTPAAKPDPHAAHKMPEKEKATNVGRPVPRKNESQPGQHQEHQEKEAKK
jgi:hypothetical protein